MEMPNLLLFLLYHDNKLYKLAHYHYTVSKQQDSKAKLIYTC